MDQYAGLNLPLAGGKSLKLTATHLVLNDPSSKKASRGSCAPFTSFPQGKQPVSLHHILWVELRDHVLHVDFAEQSSKSSMVPRKWEFSCAKEGTDSEATTPEAFVDACLARAYGESKQRKRVYVLVNPNAGPARGVQQWKTEIKPLFEAARIDFDVVILKRGGEAIDIAEGLDIDKYDAVVACSGDGTPHEIFNGLAKRPDARVALARVPVCQLPCGSGNALSINLYGSYHPSVATLSFIKGVVMPMDLISVTQGDNRILSFLSQALGIIADSDLGTENLRFLGSTRFTVSLAIKVFQKKRYPYDLAVQTVAEGRENIKAFYRERVNGAGMSKLSLDKEEEDGETADQGLPPLKYGTVKDDLPEGWKMVSCDDVANFYCGNMPFMAPDAKFFAAATPADGCMDLITVKSTIPITAAAKSLLDTDGDGFFENPNVTYQKLAAYRIIPRDQKEGYISVDGESIKFEPYQAEVHRGLCRVISKSGRFEATGPLGWEKASDAA